MPTPSSETMREGIASKGGNFILPEQETTPLIADMLRANSVLAQVVALGEGRIKSVGSNVVKVPLYLGGAEAYVVGEGQVVPVTTVEVDATSYAIKKFGSIVKFTSEQVEDDSFVPTLLELVKADVTGAIGDMVDAHALGMAAGEAITSTFSFALTAGSQEVNLASFIRADGTPRADRLKRAVSKAKHLLVKKGHKATGVIWSVDASYELEDARTEGDDTKEAYTAANPFYDLTFTFDSNLSDIEDPAEGSVVGVVGDFRKLQVALRRAIEVRPSREASVQGESSYEQDLVALRWLMRIGIGCAFPSAFVRITNEPIA